MGILGWLLGRRAQPVDERQPAPEPAPGPAPVSVPQPEPVRFRPAPPPDPRYPLNIGPIPLQLAMHVGSARAAREAGDINAARAHYQRAAYGFNQLSPEQNEALKQEIAGLTRSDPLYLDGLELVRQQLAHTPGVLQADLTRGLEPHAQEAARYVLYYADQLGDIVRVKSGRSYRLYLPAQPIPPEPEKPKRAIPKQPSNDGGASLTATISTRERTPAEERVRQLHLRATEIKKMDIQGAVECLREAQDVARREQMFGYPVAWWLRLPLFLQQAGKMQEAEAEFDRIEVDIRSGALTHGHAQVTRAYLHALNDKRRLARERQARAQAKALKRPPTAG